MTMRRMRVNPRYLESVIKGAMLDYQQENYARALKVMEIHWPQMPIEDVIGVLDGTLTWEFDGDTLLVD